MAKSAAPSGDVSDWCDGELVKGAYLRCCKTGAGAKGGDLATLSAVKKIIDKPCYDNVQAFEFTKCSKNGKMTMDTFLSKEWFLKMSKGNEAKAKEHAQKIAATEKATREKECQGQKKGSDVTSRLTDTSKYTGAHKGRFDESGKGKGIDGREDRHDNKGYVGGYKGEGTYKGDKK